MAVTTLELLEAVMAGHLITASELDELLHNRVREDLFLDYKHGNELNDRKKASATIRQYVTGFANSAGGILMVGIDQKSWSITSCATPGGKDLAEWAASCLTHLRPFFSPEPRFQVIDHPNGNVLVVATARSLGLIPCTEAGERVYYFRLHDETLSNKTVRVPEYLITDLLLGRRERPYLYISELNFGVLRRRNDRDYSIADIDFGLSFNIENQNIAWANDVIVGTIAIVKHFQGDKLALGNHLLSYIDIDNANISAYSENSIVIHSHISKKQISPFDVELIANAAIYTVPLMRYEKWYDYTWRAAVYILSNGTPPQWYQIELAVNKNLLSFSVHDTKRTEYGKFLKIEPLGSQRPIVGWKQAES